MGWTRRPFRPSSAPVRRGNRHLLSPVEPGPFRAGRGGRDDPHGAFQRCDGDEDQDLPGVCLLCGAPRCARLPPPRGPQPSELPGEALASADVQACCWAAGLSCPCAQAWAGALSKLSPGSVVVGPWQVHLRHSRGVTEPQGIPCSCVWLFFPCFVCCYHQIPEQGGCGHCKEKRFLHSSWLAAS